MDWGVPLVLHLWSRFLPVAVQYFVNLGDLTPRAHAGGHKNHIKRCRRSQSPDEMPIFRAPRAACASGMLESEGLACAVETTISREWAGGADLAFRRGRVGRINCLL